MVESHSLSKSCTGSTVYSTKLLRYPILFSRKKEGTLQTGRRHVWRKRLSPSSTSSQSCFEPGWDDSTPEQGTLGAWTREDVLKGGKRRRKETAVLRNLCRKKLGASGGEQESTLKNREGSSSALERLVSLSLSLSSFPIHTYIRTVQYILYIRPSSPPVAYPPIPLNCFFSSYSWLALTHLHGRRTLKKCAHTNVPTLLRWRRKRRRRRKEMRGKRHPWHLARCCHDYAMLLL